MLPTDEEALGPGGIYETWKPEKPETKYEALFGQPALRKAQANTGSVESAYEALFGKPQHEKPSSDGSQTDAPGVDAPATLREPEIVYDPEYLTDKQLAKLGYIRVPMVEASAGDGQDADSAYLTEIGTPTIEAESVIRDRYGIDPARLCSVRVRGISMLPTLAEGCTLHMCKWQGEYVRDGAIYMFVGPDGVQIKRLLFDRDGDAPPMIWIRSDNDAMPSYRINLDTFDRDYRLLAWALEVSRPL